MGLRKICDDNGVLLIFDEVVTGFRLAYGGAQEYFGVTPDLAAYGKIVGGGGPLSCVAGRAYLAPASAPMRSGFSFMRSPIFSATSGRVRPCRRP